MMDEQQLTAAVERAERALARGDFDAWREAMTAALEARPSEEQWALALERIRPRQLGGRAGGRPEERPQGRRGGRLRE